MSGTLQDRQTLLIVFLVVAVGFIGVAMPYPILARIFLKGNDFDFAGQGIGREVALTICLAAYPAGVLAGARLLGLMSDRFGRRPLLLAGLLGSVVAYLLSWLAIGNSWLICFLFARFLSGIFEANIPLARAVATDLSGDASRGRYFGYLGAGVYVGYFAGPLLGAWLCGFGMWLPFAAAALANAVLFGLVFFQLTETNAQIGKETRGRGGGPRIDRRVLRLLLASNVFLWISLASFYQFYPIVLVSRWSYSGYGVAGATILLTACLLSSSVLLVGRVVVRSTEPRVAALSFFAIALALFAIHRVPSVHAMWSSFVVMGVFVPIVTNLLALVVSNAVPAHEQGRVMGMINATGAVGAVVVVCIGMYSRRFGETVPFLIGSMSATCAAILVLPLLRGRAGGIEAGLSRRG